MYASYIGECVCVEKTERTQCSLLGNVTPLSYVGRGVEFENMGAENYNFYFIYF